MTRETHTGRRGRRCAQLFLVRLFVVLLASPTLAWSAAQDATSTPDPKVVEQITKLDEQFLALADEGKFREADDVIELRVALTEQTYGPDSPELFGPLVHAANMRRLLVDMKGAEQRFLRAISIAERAPKERALDIAIAINNLGVLYRTIGAYRKAIPQYERALELRIRLFGPENGSVAQTLLNYSVVLMEIGEFEKAEAFLRRALELQIKHYGEQHGNVGAAYGLLAQLSLKRGNYAEAETYGRKAYDLHLVLCQP